MPASRQIQMGGRLTITLHRTCRVPRIKGKSNPLPMSLGQFPIYRVADFLGNVPERWKREGFFFPVHPQEAMYIGFNRPPTPVALLVGAGMVNAVTGTRLEPVLDGVKQNYVVVPPQPWLDGFKSEEGSTIQFVAAELGKGETVEEQILGTAEFGGIQLGVYEPKISLIPASRPHEFISSGSFYNEVERTVTHSRSFGVASCNFTAGTGARDLGLGVGGAITQKIYPDEYLNGRDPSEVWGSEPTDKVYIHLVHASDFKAITGQDAPASPITYATYQAQGLPWFMLPDGSWGDVEGSEAIDGLKPVSGGPDPISAVPVVNPLTKDIW